MKILQGIDLLKTERIEKVYLKFGDKLVMKLKAPMKNLV